LSCCCPAQIFLRHAAWQKNQHGRQERAHAQPADNDAQHRRYRKTAARVARRLDQQNGQNNIRGQKGRKGLFCGRQCLWQRGLVPLQPPCCVVFLRCTRLAVAQVLLLRWVHDAMPVCCNACSAVAAATPHHGKNGMLNAAARVVTFGLLRVLLNCEAVSQSFECCASGSFCGQA